MDDLNNMLKALAIAVRYIPTDMLPSLAALYFLEALQKSRNPTKEPQQ
jgi:hypothetical protein